MTKSETCYVVDCERDLFARQLCQRHYYRLRKYGDPLAPGGRTPFCTVDGCSRRHYAKKMCQLHYERAKRNAGDPILRGTCPVCGEPTTTGKRRRCTDCRRKQLYAWRVNNPEKVKEMNRRSARKTHTERRERILQHYGIRCVCCGETEPAFLTMDHVNGGGNQHRRELGNGGTPAFYRWIEKQNYPDSIQVLCLNCNFAKSHHPGGCPHQQKGIENG